MKITTREEGDTRRWDKKSNIYDLALSVVRFSTSFTSRFSSRERKWGTTRSLWRCGTKLLRESIFADWWFLLYCRELIFVIRTNWFSCWELIFAISESAQYPALIIFSFLLTTFNWKKTYFQTINQYFIVYRFVPKWKRQAVIEQTAFLTTVFLCSELENIYSGVNFCGKNVCGNFYLRELIFANSWKNRKN